MRRDNLIEDNFFHILRRGAKGLPIVKNITDRWRFLRSLYYLNDRHSKVNWFRDLELSRENNPNQMFFSWPDFWPARSPLFSLCSYTLLNNHFHLIGFETKKGGISKFMQKTGISMTKHFNEKYQEKGSIFQGAYKLIMIDNNKYLKWVVPYVMAKNTFEMHPNGYSWTLKNFEQAWEWAINYDFSSLGDYGGGRQSPIIDSKLLKDIIGGPTDFKNLCKDMVLKNTESDHSFFSDIKNMSFE